MTECCLTENARRRNGSNLKMDPTRTLKLRNAFIREYKRRITRIKIGIIDFLVRKDALGLKLQKLIFNVEERQFEFQSDSGKLASFASWLQSQIDNEVLYAQIATGVLSAAPGRFTGGMGQVPWTVKYIESAYKQGLISAYLASRRNLASDDPNFITASQEDFLRQAFLAPERISKVQLLSSRSFEQLRGVTAQMAGKINTILAQGIIDGKPVTAIAREMLAVVEGITEAQAIRIARTEIIHAHAEGQLDAFDDLGVSEVGVMVEWQTAGDNDVCPVCAKLEGKTFTIEAARGKIPQHPNCRCSWVPRIPLRK